MQKGNNTRSVTSYSFAGVAFVCGVIAEKWGIARNKVPETISWQEFFSERLDNVVIVTILGYVIGFIFYKSLSGYQKHLICSKCQTTVASSNSSNSSNFICKQCSGELEPLKGFYKRHPELKDNE